MAESAKDLRELWKKYECNENEMVTIPFGPDRIRIAPPTAPAWEALASALMFHNYDIRTSDTDSYNCRNVKNSTTKSLHSFGIALDINWNTNPFLDHSGKRKVRYSNRSTQDERAQDVRFGAADTDMIEAMITDIMAIKTANGKRVFEWGGHWNTVKDCMHFEIDVSPDDLAGGIDEGTVKGLDAFAAGSEKAPDRGEIPVVSETDPSATKPPPNVMEIATRDLHRVIARRGLRLRNDASDQSEILRMLPRGTVVNVLRREGSWALVDLEMDGFADGFMSLRFLDPVSATTRPGSSTPAPTPSRPTAGRDITSEVTVDDVARMFPQTRRSNIESNLPHVLSGLRNRGLPDRDMVLMALATIRAETEGFVPINEFKSRFNTRVTPFDLYDAGTRIGRRLGNTQPGDGPRYRGRGYIQLTGRFNYTNIGPQVGVDLAGNPDLANDPEIAGLILAQFLVNKQGTIRAALTREDLRAARKAVNGGSHGLDRFTEAFRIGTRALPA